MTEIRPIADNGKVMFYPATHYQAVKDLDVGVTRVFMDNPTEFFNLLKPNIKTWHNGEITNLIKLQSPNGTAFLVSISDDGKLIITKEGNSDGNTTSN
ncbi:hypothetical protein C5Z25_00040 [Lactobacillus sp. CBA3605]|uniref:hypothetical protein n=1 Tax=Lactobacillus sp. CBA3605 TaxID=2099788 RepID=UPI000CFAFBF5|nr:hypothetical protein [Lactobacillus sp. CBA3605]AVK60259.1 hypothetical protein C5Z25_00040 [Lactobacillus sp. CBA3605]